MADAGAPPAGAHDAPPLTPRERLDVIHDHLHHAMDGLDGARAEPDAGEHGGPSDNDADDVAPRGMDRFKAKGAQQRGVALTEGGQRVLAAWARR